MRQIHAHSQLTPLMTKVTKFEKATIFPDRDNDMTFTFKVNGPRKMVKGGNKYEMHNYPHRGS